jgi:hypothetical protein
MPWIDLKTIVATALGGLALLLATIFLSSFVSSPPTRAEFDSLKTEFLVTHKSIDEKLSNIETTQDSILNHLLNRKVSNGNQKRGP